ncbi:MAG: pyruvate kinase [Bacteroidales bacterium]|nr:pyruvate kinase [Bacteroidales bacterium]
MRRTKIVATLGPAVDPPEILAGILQAGVDVARVNFSHGSEAEHLGRVTRFREAAERQGKVVAVLADLPGPKLRIRMPDPLPLKPADTLYFSLAPNPIAPGDLTITEPEILADVKAGQRILLDDGRLQLEAGPIVGQRLSAKVVVGGTLLPNKGVNLPDTQITSSPITPRDLEAIRVAAKAGADWLALSFVCGPEAAAELRAAAAVVGLHVPVLAKVERPDAVRRASAIVAAFDGIMVARGDLGVEMPLEQVPTIQKGLILEAYTAGKPVITATDMLDSMRKNPRPTRAEASDVANAVFDGTDALMLSGETAVGEYPIEAVQCMANIAKQTEQHIYESNRRPKPLDFVRPGEEIETETTEAAVRLAEDLRVDAIVTPTFSGRTARLIVRHRPAAPVIALGPNLAIVRQLAVSWGVTPVLMNPLQPGESRMMASVRDAYLAGAVKVGNRVVVIAGHPLEGGQHQPTIRVLRVGEGGASLSPRVV